LTLNSTNKTFSLQNVYTFNGAYTVKVTVLDDDGGSSFTTMKVTVSGGLDRMEDYLSSCPPPAQVINGGGPSSAI
jgi:hypothetical protein